MQQVPVHLQNWVFIRLYIWYSLSRSLYCFFCYDESRSCRLVVFILKYQLNPSNERKRPRMAGRLLFFFFFCESTRKKNLKIKKQVPSTTSKI